VRQQWILVVLRRFWMAMIAGDADAARAVMAEDTAHWMADLPQRFAAAAETPPAQSPLVMLRS
jgi:ketosteroid isomerase-like protein